MSYVSEKKRGNPAGMGAAVLVNGSIILAVALSPIIVDREKGPTVINGVHIPEPVPPPPKPDEKQEAKKLDPIFAPPRQIDTQTPPDNDITTTGNEADSGSIMDGAGGDDTMTVIPDPPKPMPIFKAALRDPRFARDFQPDYPVGKLKLEIEGSATVRVLIGTDGRVRQVQVVRATDPDFARATERQARRAWRFKPAMRDGVPVEDWQTLTVRFDIN